MARGRRLTRRRRSSFVVFKKAETASAAATDAIQGCDDDDDSSSPDLQYQSCKSNNPHEHLEWWDEMRPRIRGPFSQTEGSLKFENVFKIARPTFDYICSLVREDLMARRTPFSDMQGRPLTVNDLVAVSIRRLTSGDPLNLVGETFGVQGSTVNNITWQFVQSMAERGVDHVHWPSTEKEMEEVKLKFQKISGLPNCCGAVGTTRILMTLSTSDPTHENWVDYNNNHTMVLQVVADADMKFIDVCAGWPGMYGEGVVLKMSEVFMLCSKKRRLNGDKVHLSSEGTMLREFLVADADSPLLTWLLTPYKGKHLTDYQTNFNKKHCVSHMVAKKALARLRSDWKVIDGAMWRPDLQRLPCVILVCCILHNIVIDMEKRGVKPHSHHHDSDNGAPVLISSASDINVVAPHVDASAQRDALSMHLFGQSSQPGSTSTMSS